MRLHRRIALTGLATTVLLLSACSALVPSEGLGQTGDSSNGPRLFDTPEQGANWALEHGYDRLAQQLDDGGITAEEYEVAYLANVSCQEKSGWTFASDEAVWNPVDHRKLIREGHAPAKPDAAKEKACSDQFDYVDYLFQTTATPRMDSQLLSAVQACLEKAGIEYVHDATNLPDLVGPDAGSSKNADVIAGCVTDEAYKLYPDLPGLGIAF